MFSLTWIDNGKVQSISHPIERVIMALWFAMYTKGKQVRMWDKSKQLIA